MPLSHLSFKQKSWRLSPMYLFYFSLFGSVIPYIARFLTEHGLSPREASQIVAVMTGVNMFAPFLFSFLADRSGRRLFYIRLGYFAIGFFYLLALQGSGFWYYLSIFFLFGVFLSAVLPQMESVTLTVLADQRRRYGQIRLWGSIGFVCVVWLLGNLLDYFSSNIIVYFGVGLSILMFLSTFLIPEQPRKQAEKDDAKASSEAKKMNKVPLRELPWMQISVLLLVVLMWQFGMAPYNTFFDLYMRGHGFSAATNGFLISFGSFCEIAIFIVVARFFNHYSERLLICVGLIFTIARWLLLYAFADSFMVVLLSQSFHAMTFGVVHSVAVHRIGRLFPEGRASFGQGLYVALGMGFGLFAGNMLAGWLWDGTGIIYLQAAGWAFLATLVAWFGFKEPIAQR